MERLKNMKKDQWLIVILAGILLFVIVLPTKPKNSEKTENKENFSTRLTETGTSSEKSTDNKDYQTYLEDRLEKILSQMQGVGKVKVMINLADSGEEILQKDQKENNTKTQENGAEESRLATQTQLEDATIFVEEDGKKVPYVVQTKNPTVEGVVVVCEGGENQMVVQNISKAVGALFSVESHKIMVMKME